MALLNGSISKTAMNDRVEVALVGFDLLDPVGAGIVSAGGQQCPVRAGSRDTTAVQYDNGIGESNRG